MVKKLSIFIFVIIIWVSNINNSFLSAVSEDSDNLGKTLYVGSDEIHKTVQSAIDAAAEGDTVCIKSGFYTERININKNKLTLTGEGVEKTFFEGSSRSFPAITVNNVTQLKIEHMTINNGKEGIEINGSKSVTINNCKIKFTKNSGVYADSNSDTITISGCEISDCYQGTCCRSNNTSVSNCRIFNNNTGIELQGKYSNVVYIRDNDVFSNSSRGCYISSVQFFIENNRINYNNTGIGLIRTRIDTIVDSKRFIRGNELFYNSSYGIESNESSGVTIENNYIYTNNENSNNANYAIYDICSEKFIIKNNTISNYSYGIALCKQEYFDSYNQQMLVYNNDLIDNVHQALDESKDGRWDNGEMGNYWSGYKGEDIEKDGIGDSPYVITEGTIRISDNFPSMKQINNKVKPTSTPVHTLANDHTATSTAITTSTSTPISTTTPEATISVTPAPSHAVTSALPSGNGYVSVPAAVVPGAVSEITTTPTKPSNTTPTATIPPKSTTTPTSTISSTPVSTSAPLTTNTVNKTPGNSKIVDLKDINGHWANKYIKDVVSMGIMEGKGNGLFAPDDFVNRAECAKVLMVLTGNSKQYDDNVIFKDVAKSDWFYTYINSAYKCKMILGYPDKTFKPRNYITREDIVVTLSNVLKNSYGFKGIRALKINYKTGEKETISDDNIKGTLELPFNDTERISAYAMDGVATAVNYGLVAGKQDNKFVPKGKATRAEMAVILSRLVSKYGYPGS